MIKFQKELIIEDKVNSNTVIQFQPNWQDWESTRYNTSIGTHTDDKYKALYIHLSNDISSVHCVLSLKQMKKLKKFLNEKIKIMEGEL